MTKTIEQIANHLEFLGYKTEKKVSENSKEKDFFIATHPDNNSLLFWEYLSFVSFRVNLTTPKKSPVEKLNKFIVDANKSINISKLTYDLEESDTCLRFNAVYAGDYSKEKYGQFYNAFENDQRIISKVDNFQELFLN